MKDLPAHADIDSFLATAQRVCDGADQALIQGYGQGIASRKADGSLVTQIDRAVDEYISSQLALSYPDHAILSEERTTHYDPSVLFTWVVDPLDGTTNFARGIPIWGVSIALLYHGLPILGVLSFVSLHERYTATLGGGAALNQSTIHTASELAADDQHFLMLCTRTQKRYHIRSPLKPRILGSAAYHLATVANGSALAGVESTPKLWDIAAGLLILLEAGGCYKRIGDSTPIFPLPYLATDYEQLSFPLLTAANPSILAELEHTLVRA